MANPFQKEEPTIAHNMRQILGSRRSWVPWRLGSSASWHSSPGSPGSTVTARNRLG